MVRYVFEVFPSLETAIIGAHPENVRAIRAYGKAGFRPVEVDVNDPYIGAYDKAAGDLVFLELRKGVLAGHRDARQAACAQ